MRGPFSGTVLTTVLCGFALLVQFAIPAVADSDLGGPFELIDQHGTRVTQATYLGKPALIYFGFASCGYICPTDLARMAAVTNALAAESAIQITPIFITIDPERDTPERLASYVAQFHPRFVGLTGSPEQIADVADKYAVYYAPVKSGDTYVMDHSTFTFLIGADGNYIAHFDRDVPAPELTARIRALLAKP